MPAGQKRQCNTAALHAFIHLRGKNSLHSAAAPRVRYTLLHESTRSGSRTCRAPCQSTVSMGRKAHLSTRTLWFSVAGHRQAALPHRLSQYATPLRSAAFCSSASQRHGQHIARARQAGQQTGAKAEYRLRSCTHRRSSQHGALEYKSANIKEACAPSGAWQLRFAPLPAASPMRKRREEL